MLLFCGADGKEISQDVERTCVATVSSSSFIRLFCSVLVAESVVLA